MLLIVNGERVWERSHPLSNLLDPSILVNRLKFSRLRWAENRLKGVPS
jgi:hypothetical protein